MRRLLPTLFILMLAALFPTELWAEKSLHTLSDEVGAVQTEQRLNRSFDRIHRELKPWMLARNSKFQQILPPINAAPRSVGAVEVKDANGIITTPAEGEHKFYTRSGDCYTTSNQQVTLTTQGDHVEIVECSDGTIYIKDPVSTYTTGVWVKGSKAGNTITVPAKQPLAYSSNYATTLSMRWGVVNASGSFSAADDHADNFTYTIDGNVISLQGTSIYDGATDNYFMGVYWDDDNSFSGSGDASSVYTLAEGYEPASTDPIVPPTGLVAETWNVKYESQSNSGSATVVSTANVGFVGNEVYVQGLFSDFPEAWVKGTIDGSNVTFSKFQFLGNYSSYNIWMVGATTGEESKEATLEDFRMTYDADAKVLTAVNDVLANAAEDRVYYLSWASGLVIQEETFAEKAVATGEPVDVLPYTNDFANEATEPQFGVIDANSDSTKWLVYAPENGPVCYRVKYNSNLAADDWLVSPAIKLEAGKVYRFAIQAKSESSFYPERIEVKLGTEAKASVLAEGASVIAPTDVTWSAYQVMENVALSVEETGYYHFGIHGISDADCYYLSVTDFSVKPADPIVYLTAEGNGTANIGPTVARNSTATRTVSSGASPVLTLMPDEGYIVDSLSVNGVDRLPQLSKDNTLLIENITSNTTVYVRFSQPKVVLTAEGNGTASIGTTVARNSTVTRYMAAGARPVLTLTPDEGHIVDSLSVDGVDRMAWLSKNNTLLLDSVTSVTNVYVRFSQPKVVLTAEGNGTASIGTTEARNSTATRYVAAGARPVLTLTPDEKSFVCSIVVDGNERLPRLDANTLLLDSVVAATTVVVRFAKTPEQTVPPTGMEVESWSTSYKYYEFNGTTRSPSYESNGETSERTGDANIGFVGNEVYVQGLIGLFPMNWVKGTIDGSTVTFSRYQYLGTRSGEDIYMVGANYDEATQRYTPDDFKMVYDANAKTLTAMGDVVANRAASHIDGIAKLSNLVIQKPRVVLTAEGNGTAAVGTTVARNSTATRFVPLGGSPVLTVTPDEGHYIDSLSVDGVSQLDRLSPEGTLLLGNIVGSTNVYVHFAQPQVVLTAEGNGTANIGTTVARNSTATRNVSLGACPVLTLTPDLGHIVDSLSVDGVDRLPQLSKDNTLLLDSITANIHVFVRFAPSSDPIVTLTAEGNGTAAIGTTEARNSTAACLVSKGTRPVLTLTPDEGHIVDSLSVNGVDLLHKLAARILLDSITANTTIYVRFAKPRVVLDAKGNGTASIGTTVARNSTATRNVALGARPVLLLEPDEGHIVDSLLVDGIDRLSGPTQTTLLLDSVTSVTNVYVRFSQPKVVLTAEGNGTASIGTTVARNGSATRYVAAGARPVLLLTPDERYFIDSISVDGVDRMAWLSKDNTLLLDGVTTITNVYVRFSQPKVLLTAEGNGTANIGTTEARNSTATRYVSYGAQPTLTLTPDEGYIIDSLSVNGKDQLHNIATELPAPQLLLDSIKANTSVYVHFTQPRVTLTAEGNGIASIAGAIARNNTTSRSVAKGTDLLLTVTPDDGHIVESLSIDGTDRLADLSRQGTLQIDSITRDVDIRVSFTIPKVVLTAEGNGTAAIGTTTARNNTVTRNVNAGASPVLTLTPDDGYIVDSLFVDGADRTADLSANGTLTLDNIRSVVVVRVCFAQPKVVLTAEGNGTASIGTTVARNSTVIRSVTKYARPVLVVTPDEGYDVDSISVNGIDRRANLSADNTLLLNSVETNTAVFVRFTQPKVVLTAEGNGTAAVGTTVARNGTATRYVALGAKPVLTLTPDEGHIVDSLSVNGTDQLHKITPQSRNPQLLLDSITGNTYVHVSFSLPKVTLIAEGNGTAAIGNTSARNSTATRLVALGASPILSLTPDNGHYVAALSIDGVDRLDDLSREKSLQMDRIAGNVTVRVTFARSIIAFTHDGIDYDVMSMDDRIVQVEKVGDRQQADIPQQVVYGGLTFSVESIHERAFANCASLVSVALPASVKHVPARLFNGCNELAAIEWNANTRLTLPAPANPNLLLYVADASLAPEGIRNVVADGVCESLVLCDTTDNVPHGFHAPRAFTARHAEYTHTYTLETPMNSQQGWETLALPFDVQTVSHEKRGEVVPFAARTANDNRRAFWLYGFGTEGYGEAFTRASAIMAYRPYLIAMPNNEDYKTETLLAGRVTFSAENVEIAATDIQPVTYGRREMTPNMRKTAKAANVYALNIGGEGDESPGSAFIPNCRDVQPFQCHITLKDMENAPRLLSLKELLASPNPTPLDAIPDHTSQTNDDTYDLRGVKIKDAGKQTRIVLKGGRKHVEGRRTR